MFVASNKTWILDSISLDSFNLTLANLKKKKEGVYG